MNIEWLTNVLVSRGWLLLLAFTAAVLVVAVLRKPCRRWFGTERAFQLWLLPPLAMLASQLPHEASKSLVALPALVYVITSAANALPEHANAFASAGWRVSALAVWLAGMLLATAVAVLAQWRYHRHLAKATLLPEMSQSWPVLRAASGTIGPALVGAWRSRIVLPVDFEQRYDATEQTLILAHEAMHARRRDGYGCLLAQIVAVLFWFHPLAWWALSALRQDQELACDAAVLREHDGLRRTYANAMLKTQSASFTLPVGCLWSPRHPLTERIAMLKLHLPSRARRHVGMLAGFGLAALVVGTAYAATAPTSSPAATPAGTVSEYQLDMTLALTSDKAAANHVERTTVAMCMLPGKSGTLEVHGWKIDATTVPEGRDRVRVDLAVASSSTEAMAHTQLRGALGQPMHAEGKGNHGLDHYVVDVTAHSGCPARTATADSGHRSRLINHTVKSESARSVAIAIARKAGLKLVNPELLGNGLVTLNFDQVTAERALMLVADVAGKKAIFEGDQVRFEAK